LQVPSWINVANLLTLSRLASVPFIIEAILDGRHIFALAVFAAAALTDVLDGAAARRWGVNTQTGAYLDPVADKCLLSGVFLALAAARIVPLWFVLIVFGRDIYILLGAVAAMLFTDRRRFPPSVWGKASTFVQIVTAVTWMARNIFPSPALDSASSAMLWLCAAFTIWSGIDYSWRGIQTLRAH
jgi:cardiolipin synthase